MFQNALLKWMMSFRRASWSRTIWWRSATKIIGLWRSKLCSVLQVSRLNSDSKEYLSYQESLDTNNSCFRWEITIVPNGARNLIANPFAPEVTILYAVIETQTAYCGWKRLSWPLEALLSIIDDDDTRSFNRPGTAGPLSTYCLVAELVLRYKKSGFKERF